MILGALEAGGTKMVCAIGDEGGHIFDKKTFPTNDPSITMPSLTEYFASHAIKALGIGCFGPIDLDVHSTTYGTITSTPKQAWRYFPIVDSFCHSLSVPIGFDTDVNASLLGEASFGALQGISDSLYITIGTGIGAGIMSNKKLLHGMLHPEAGHILLQKHPSDSSESVCPFHSHCFEGLASGPAILKRYGIEASLLPPSHEAWEMEAYYIGQALTNYILILSPKKIVLGGGVMNQRHLFPLIHKEVKSQLANYIATKELSNLADYIIPPICNDNQGILGALQLAYLALTQMK